MKGLNVKTLKKIGIVLGVLFAVLVILKTAVPKVNTAINADSPIVSIEAYNNTLYRYDTQLRVSDFTVKAIHENGNKTTLTEQDFYIDREYPGYIGEETPVIITLATNEAITCTTNIFVEREPVYEFACGTPNINDVTAILYSNGELCFEGKGDIVKVENYAYPWKYYEDIEAYPIRSVSFEKDIAPKNLDGMFSDIYTLEYVDKIPSSVESLSQSFMNCSALTTSADWSACENLLNISECYRGCTALISVMDIPASVRFASSAFTDCDALETAPEMSHCINLINAYCMFEGCRHLSHVGVLPNNLDDISWMFYRCINLKTMPEIPESVTKMQGTFSNCVTLTTPTIIPKNVIDVRNCFEGCSALSGMLWVDGNPYYYEECFITSVAATTLDLQGNSKIRDLLAQTSGGNINITVDGAPPKNITWEEIFPEEE